MNYKITVIAARTFKKRKNILITALNKPITKSL